MTSRLTWLLIPAGLLLLLAYTGVADSLLRLLFLWFYRRVVSKRLAQHPPNEYHGWNPDFLAATYQAGEKAVLIDRRRRLWRRR